MKQDSRQAKQDLHRVRSRLFLALRIAMPFIIFAVLLAVVDLQAAFRLLADAAPGLVIVCILLVQVQIGLAALRWWLTARSIGQPLSLKRAVTEYYGASLVNMILPGGVSGDVLRVARNRNDDGAAGWERPVQSVVLERLSGQAAFAVVAVCGLGLWIFLGESRIPVEAFGGVLAVFGLVVALAALSIVVAVFARGRLKALLRRTGEAVRLVFLRPRQAVFQFGLSLLVVAAYLAAFSLASRAIGAPLDPGQTLFLIPPVLLTMLLPISIGGWGAREAAAAALWPLAGFAPSEGVAASVLYGLISTAGALPGLFTFDFGGSSRTVAREPHHAPSAASKDESRA